MNQTKIIAHRGESVDAPENTLAAITLAWERGVKAVEIDIQLTADNEIVVIHDKNTLRVTGEKKLVRKSSLIELKLLNAGFYKPGDWGNEHIPTLAEVLKTVPVDGKLIIEIKSNDSILSKLKDELSRSKLKHSQIELIAFNKNTLSKAKNILPEYRMLWLLNLDNILFRLLYCSCKKLIISNVKKLKIDGIDVWAGKLLTPKFITTFKKAGLIVYCWTVDDPEKARALLKNGIDGITTNRAYWIINKLKIN